MIGAQALPVGECAGDPVSITFQFAFRGVPIRKRAPRFLHCRSDRKSWRRRFHRLARRGNRQFRAPHRPVQDRGRWFRRRSGLDLNPFLLQYSHLVPEIESYGCL